MLGNPLIPSIRFLYLLFITVGALMGILSVSPHLMIMIIGLLLTIPLILKNYKAAILVGLVLIPINQVPFVDLGKTFSLSVLTLGIGLFGMMVVLHRQWNHLTFSLLGLLLYVMLEVVLTAYKYDHGLDLPFKNSVSYFLFLFAFAVIALTPKESDVMSFLLLTLVTNVGLSFFYIIQSLTGSNVWDIFTHQYNILEEGFAFRIFNYATYMYDYLFLVSMSMVMFTKRYRPFFVVCAGFLLIAILANFSRANYLSVGVGFIGASLYFFKQRSRQTRLVTLIWAILGPMIGFSVLMMIDPSIRDTVIDRGFSAVNDLRYNTGTWGARTNIYGLYLDVISNDPIFGAGFVHPDTGIYSYLPRGALQNSDLGFLNVFVVMGPLGGVVYLYFIIQILRFAARAKSPNVSPIHKVFSFSCFAYVVGGLISSITNPIFVGPAGILPLAMGIGLMLSTQAKAAAGDEGVQSESITLKSDAS